MRNADKAKIILNIFYIFCWFLAPCPRKQKLSQNVKSIKNSSVSSFADSEMTGLIALSSLYAKYEASARKQLAYFSLKSENKGKQIDWLCSKAK